MDDLCEDPIKVASDIIDQGTKGLKFSEESKNRIVNILKAYHACLQENLKIKEKIKAEEEIIVEREVCWKAVDDKRNGPYCSRCWIINSVLMPMEDHGNGIHTCLECNNSWDDGTYQDPRDESGGYSWRDAGR